MRIEAHIPKKKQFLGEVLTYKGGLFTFHARTLKYCRKLWGYKNLPGVDFDQFTAIKKNTEKIMLER